MGEVELLSPAGDFETARAAFAAGADAVYCGLADFSARAFAKNFSEEDLKNLIAYAHAQTPPRRVYVTFNTLLDEDRTEDAIVTLAHLDALRPDGLIIQDLGVARICRRHFPSLALHASTQLVIHNLEGVLAMRDLGFTRVVLARELSLEEIASISRRCGDMELECFIHGALCYSISGLCLYGAMEKGRSGNRGTCPYCCRQSVSNGKDTRYPFSMKDLRLGEDVRKLVDAGVVSLKIEGRMKSPLYVASVTRYYRDILSSAPRRRVTTADLETVFSRRTTELYLNGAPSSSPIDAESLGHLGTEVGVVKRLTRDRDGLRWLRFHTCRALEKHDGLQFAALDENGRHYGLGIAEMRQAISRRLVFEVNAGTDVEVLVPETDGGLAEALRPGMKIYCSMSNAVKRMFPTPSFRPSDFAGGTAISLRVTLASDGIAAEAKCPAGSVAVRFPCSLSPAKDPSKTPDGVRKCFAKLGGTDYRLDSVELEDPDRLFAPMSVLNDLRRDLVERLDDAMSSFRRAKIDAAIADAPSPDLAPTTKCRRLKLRIGQKIPAGKWDEIIVAVSADTEAEEIASTILPDGVPVRLAVPAYTAEPEFNRLRNAVKRLHRAGYGAWEASDLATLRMLKACGVGDITADWTLYAFNAQALQLLAEGGVRRFVASPENTRENLQYLFESGFPVEFLSQQSTPLFISLTQPDESAREVGGIAVSHRNGLWITAKAVPRTFSVPEGASERIDLSWDPDEI